MRGAVIGRVRRRDRVPEIDAKDRMILGGGTCSRWIDRGGRRFLGADNRPMTRR